MLSKKIAIIGAPDTILPFSAIGADAYDVMDSESAETTLDEVILKDYGIIYLEEAYAKNFSEKIEKLNNAHREVAITVIAGSRGGSNMAVEKIRNQVKKAVGMDLFSE